MQDPDFWKRYIEEEIKAGTRAYNMAREAEAAVLRAAALRREAENALIAAEQMRQSETAARMRATAKHSEEVAAAARAEALSNDTKPKKRRRRTVRRSDLFTVEVPTVDGAIFELLGEVGCRMPTRRKRRD